MNSKTRAVSRDKVRPMFAWLIVATILAGHGTIRAKPIRPEPVVGHVTLVFDSAALQRLGMKIVTRPDGTELNGAYRVVFPVPKSRNELLVAAGHGQFGTSTRGTVGTRGALLVAGSGWPHALIDPTIVANGDGRWTVVAPLGPPGSNEPETLFLLRDVMLDAPSASSTLRMSGELLVANALAIESGAEEAAYASVGRLWMDLTTRPDQVEPPRPAATRASSSAGATTMASGADVIVGELPDVNSYGSSNGVAAFSVGTTSCNIGDAELLWISDTPDHPVIGQSLYRLKDDRLEQIGQSWLKHGFLALALNACELGCNNPNDGARLGVGCSDPYCASLNGFQDNLGPKSEVNAFTGSFGFPPSLQPSIDNTVGRRLQVNESDLDPALAGGGLYFVEGHYVTPDDAAAGNQNNNASYRPVSVQFLPGPGRWTLQLQGTTQRQRSAIRAWRDTDPAVVEDDIVVPDEGLFILAGKAIDAGGGLWRYEYALQNLTSDRSAGSFSIPVPFGATVSEIGFHDVAYHSGEIYDGTDWNAVVADGRITWSTEGHDLNANANALRWGTLYNFRMTIDAPPQLSVGTVGLFKPGIPASVAGSTVGPALGVDDCNNNQVPDACDVACDSPACQATGWTGACGNSPDCNTNDQPDECDLFDGTSSDCNANGLPDSCELADGSAQDCNGNLRPDACDTPDCDGNGIPDDCELVDGDCNGDGLLDSCVPPAVPPMADPDFVLTNRFLPFAPPPGFTPTAYRLRFRDVPPPNDGLNGATMWVGSPRDVSELGGRDDDTAPTFKAATLQCDPHFALWDTSETIHVYHEGIVPGGIYELRTVTEGCPVTLEASFSNPLELLQASWGDVAGRFQDGRWSPPNDSVDITSDVVAILDAFGGGPAAMRKARADIEPATPDLKINITDVTAALDAFGGRAFPFTATIGCP